MKSIGIFLNVVCFFYSFSALAIAPEAAQLKKQLQQHCLECHTGTGPAVVFTGDFLDEGVLNSFSNFQDPIASNLFQQVTTRVMPEGILGENMSNSQRAKFLEDFVKWVQVGGPPLVNKRTDIIVSRQDVYEEALADLQSAPSRAAQKRFRYLDLSHLLNQGLGEEELALYPPAISKLLNSLSLKNKISKPKVGGPQKILIRLDLAQWGWNSTIWKKMVSLYPYHRLEGIQNLANQITDLTEEPISIIRGDWFLDAASRPPLYHFLARTPKTAGELERALGVDVNKNIANGTARRAGFVDSGVSSNNRILERHNTDLGAYWISYDFKASVGQENIFDFPLGPTLTPQEIQSGIEPFKHAGGEVIYNLPNGMQAYMLIDAAGNRIDQGPIEIVSDPLRPDKLVTNGVSCMTCHSTGMNKKKDQINLLFNDYDRFLGLEVFHEAYSPPQPPVGTPGDPGNQVGLEVTKQRVAALYGDSALFEQLLDNDSLRFQEASKAAGYDNPANSKQEAIGVTTRKFNRNLSLAAAASEFGLNIEDFSQIIEKLKDDDRTVKQLHYFLKTLGRTVRRDYFEFSYQRLAALIMGEAEPDEPIDPADSPQFKKKSCNSKNQCIFRQGSAVYYQSPQKAKVEILFSLDYPHTFLDINEKGQWVALVSQSLFSGTRDLDQDIKQVSFAEEVKVGVAQISSDGIWAASIASQTYAGRYDQQLLKIKEHPERYDYIKLVILDSAIEIFGRSQKGKTQKLVLDRPE